MTLNQVDAYILLRKRVRNAHIRRGVILFVFHWIKALFYALLGICLVGVIFKFLPWPSMNLVERGVSMVLLVLSLPTAGWSTWRKLGNARITAQLADQQLHFKEKISSALEFGMSSSSTHPTELEWNQAVLRDALSSLGRWELKKAFPFTFPREGRWMWAPGIALMLNLFVLPQWNYERRPDEARAAVLDPKQAEKERQKWMQRQLVIERQAQEKESQLAGELAKEIKDLAAELSKGQIEQREALAKFSSLEQEWEKRKEQLEEEKLAPMKPLPNDRQPRMTRELAEALENNDFEKAAQKLGDLQKQLKMGDLDPAAQKELGEELKQLASVMDLDLPVVKALENAAELLQTAHLDEALQRLQLVEMDMANLQDLVDQIALIDAALLDLKESKFALAGQFGREDYEGKSFANGNFFAEGAGNFPGNGNGLGYGTGAWKAGESRQQGYGMGGPGIGQGGNAPFAQTETELTSDPLKGMFGNAPIQAVLPVDGESIKGESTIGVNDNALFEFNQRTEEAMTRERVPLPYRQQVRLYFEMKDERSR